VFTAAGAPLFPRRQSDLQMSCSCPDYEVPCKHLSAVFYLRAERFDDDPSQILHWRGRDRASLLGRLRELRGDAPSVPDGPPAPGAAETPPAVGALTALADLVATDRAVDAVDAVCDLLLAEDLGVNQVTAGPWHETLHHFVVHPVGMYGSDSTFVGAKPSPRTYGSFPRVLGEFVRERHLLGLEEAVRKMTSAAAARLGITDRGRLADGSLADVVVFDPQTVASNATYDEPRRFPTGIDYVIVNGRIVVADDRHTGELPGRVIRRSTTT